jgi:hypothetical protein
MALSWFFSETTLGLVGWLGLLLGLIGLFLTFKEARNAKTAAVAARVAVEQLEGKLNIAQLSYANAQLDVVRQLATKDEFDTALIVFAPIKRTVVHGAVLLGKRDNAKNAADLARRNLARIETQLAAASENAASFKKHVLYGAIRGLTEFLAEWEGHLTFDRQEK